MADIKRPPIIPVANCLKDIINKTDKRHIFITGSKGIGKSTLLNAALGEIGTGLQSEAVWDEATVHPSYITLKDMKSGETSVIGRYENGRMKPEAEGFKLGIKAIDEYDGNGFFVIDEIGFLEENVSDYKEAVLKLLSNHRVIAVIRKQDTKFLNQLIARDDVVLIDLDSWYENYEKQKIACIILASGFSRRFSGNKLTAEFEGAPLICSLFSSLPKDAFYKILTVTRYEEVKKLSEKENIGVIIHDMPYLSDTIRLGVGAIEDADGYMISVSDQPLISKETFLTLILRFALHKDKIIRPINNGTPGNPVIFPVKYRDELMSIKGDVGGRAVIKAHTDAVITQEIEDQREFFDVDTKENLKEIKNI